jgi:dethiobiotin synthetase
MNYFVTAIGTDSGKTVVSAILCKALDADYWKPVQAGFPTDAETVRSLLGNTASKIHPEQYLLKTPASPHAAAALENIEIKLENFVVPHHTSHLIIEGAGGCLVPLNDQNFVIDLATEFKAEIVLVSNLYLGSINHTLLTWEALKQRKLKVKGIIFNGVHNAESERIILHHTGLRRLLHVEQEHSFSDKLVDKYSKKLMENWNG